MKENTKLVEPKSPTVIPIVTKTVLKSDEFEFTRYFNVSYSPWTMLNPVVSQLITEVDGLWKLALSPPTTDKPA